MLTNEPLASPTCGDGRQPRRAHVKIESNLRFNEDIYIYESTALLALVRTVDRGVFNDPSAAATLCDLAASFRRFHPTTTRDFGAIRRFFSG